MEPRRVVLVRDLDDREGLEESGDGPGEIFVILVHVMGPFLNIIDDIRY